MYIPSRRNRRALRGWLLVVAVCLTVAALGVGWIALDEARGGTVDAEVVGIEHNASGRRVYDVRFEVAGRICSARVDSGSDPLPRDVQVGAISRLRYSASSPCTKVRETIRPGLGPLPIILAVVAIGLWAAVWRLRPGPSAPTSDRGPVSEPGGAG